METNKNNNLGLIYVILATVLFSSKSIVVQLLYQFDTPVEQIISLRMLISAPLYIFIAISSAKALKNLGHKLPTKTEYCKIMLSGFMCYHVASYLDMWALQHITAGLERIILFTYPLFVAIYQSIRGERLTGLQYFAIIFSYLGVLLFYLEDHDINDGVHLVGVLAVIGAVILTATFVIKSQYYSRKYSSSFFTSMAMGFAALTVNTQVVLLGDLGSWTFAPKVLGLIACIALFCTVIPSFLLNKGICNFGAVRSSVVGMIGPPITVLMSNCFLGTETTNLHYVALGMVILGSVSLIYGKTKYSPSPGLKFADRSC
jgi:drug/metabolite transporter (DMT)-like permease